MTRSAKSIIVAAAVSVLALTGCNNSVKTLKTQTYTFDDSSKYADLTVRAELPVSTKGIAGKIREGLIDIMDGQLAFIGSYEGDRLIEPFDGNRKDNAAVVDYYRRKALELLDSEAAEDYDYRATYLSEEELEDFPRWEYDFTLDKQYETDRFVVFNSTDYVYLGGAHGGVIGQGSPTFDKKDGSLVTEFLRDDARTPMQQILLGGLLEYFADDDDTINEDNIFDYLFVDNKTIPFPEWTPHPTAEGLCFVYQQYEIAAYAMGMPSFIIPYETIKPFLTPQALDLLDLD